ncbi:MAG: acyltransferase domain-containing protein [Xanthomonadales bacterium]|nr:acyltransferase domain-containing protein [Xanthomonadales bacterium]
MTPIAIVGRACVLPGVLSPQQLWDAVLAGRDLTRSAPAGRWRVPPPLCAADAPQADHCWSDRGGYVEGFEAIWDPRGFALPPEQLAGLDPLVHWLLHCGREALAQVQRPARVGAVVGNLGFPSEAMADYADRVWRGLSPGDPRNRAMSGGTAAVLAQALALSAGSWCLDAACASSLYAIKLACDALADGEADLMLAGAVQRADDLFLHQGFAALGALSKSGQSRPFHRDADGLLPAEGCAFLALKRLEDARRDGDTIHAVIRGIGLSNDGRGKGLLVPDESGQRRAMAAALADAGIDPAQVSLLECHATGTPVGDGTELASTAQVYGARPLPIGSLKSNLGHLITSAGAAGLIKLTEALRHGVLPPNRAVDAPIAALAASSFRLLQQPEPWPADAPRIAAISAFGFGGNNAHLILSADDPAISAAAAGAPATPIAIVGLGACIGGAMDRAAVGAALFGEAVTDARMDAIELDLAGLRFPPNDLKQALPQQLAMLRAAREALAQSGPLPPCSSVLVGMEPDAEVARYGTRWRSAGAVKDGVIAPLEAAGVLGCMPNIPANRLSSQFDCGGPSYTVQAGADSGAAALAIACRALASGEIDAALVGAVDLCDEPVTRAAGNAQPGDAAVALVLKRLADAEREGLRVLAVVGLASRHPSTGPSCGAGGRGQGTHRVALTGLVEDWGVTSYIEGDHEAQGNTPCPLPPAPAFEHGGQGTDRVAEPGPVEDREAANRVEGDREAAGNTPCPLPPAPAFNYGAATALVHAVHATLCLHHRRQADGRPWLGAATRTVDLPLAGRPGIRLSEARGHRRVSESPQPRLHLYAGADRAALVAALRVDRPGGDGPTRVVLVARPDELAETRQRALAHLIDGAPAGQSVHFCERPSGGELAFCFAGAGASYRGMGRELLLALPQLLERLAARSARLCEVLDWSFDQAAPPPSALQQLWGASGLSQAHAEFSAVLGLKPDAWLGYSSGETNALVASGAWRDADALMHEMESSGLVTRLLGGAFEAVAPQWGRAVDWASWTVLAPLAEVRAALTGVPRVHLAIINSDSDSLIAGEAEGCARVVERLGAHRCLKLDYPLAVHVPELDAVAGEWLALHRRQTHPTHRGRLYSTAAARAYAPEREACAQAILAQANRTLDLRPLVLQAWEDGVRVFVEHGPGNSFARAIRNILGPREALVVGLDRKGAGLDGALAAAAALLAAGVPVDVDALHAELPCVAPSPAPQRPMRFAAHWPPVRLQPPAQHMPPAPALPPVLDGYRQRAVTRPVAAVAEIVRAPAAQADRQAAPAIIHRAPASIAAISALQRTVADLSAAHQGHIAALAGAQQQYLAVLGKAQGLLLRRPERSPVCGAKPLTGYLPQAPGERAARAHRATRAGAPTPAPQHEGAPVPAPRPLPPAPLPASPRLTRADLETHASGRISDIFGPAFAGQDGYTRQVRMPEPPLLLCDRVVAIDGEPMGMGKGRIVTQTEVANHGWALLHGRLPAGVMIEAGQADLMLISWLGVDALNRGERVYRLLGCELTYHGDLPRAGDTLHFDIVLDGHAAQGDVRLMFFHYDCVNGGRAQLSVRGGQAGFFTDAELAASAGCLWSPQAQAIVDTPRLDPPAAACTRTTLARADLEALAAGDAASCFGAGFERARTHTRTPSIHAGRMLLLDRVTELAIDGGPWRRGYLRAELDIHPAQWFFAGHFKNDPCMPGTLMFEACLQAMAVYLAGCGYTLKRDGWRFQPVPELPYQLQCRGQVTPRSRLLVTEVFVEERIAEPRPTIYADLLCTVDGLKAFHARRVALELVPDWPLADAPADAPVDLHAPVVDGFRFDRHALLASALGRPSQAFGPMYARFDGSTRVPRLPSPPYFFISRIARIDGPIGVMQAGARVVAEYDVPDEAWYFRDNGAPVMPFAVLLEAALQPCGWLASYVGSALTADGELGFRNLDGEGEVLAELTPGCGTLVTEVELTRVSASGGMIIQGFAVRCHLGGRDVYRLQTVFGFFPPEALAAQAGLPEDAAMRGVLEGVEERGWGLGAGAAAMKPAALSGKLPGAAEPHPCAPAPSPQPRSCPNLPHGKLRLLDSNPRIDLNAGQVCAGRQVDPGEWYFKAHFFSDPVQPGSLGLEALLQALQCYLIDWNAHAHLPQPRFECIATGIAHRWKYRGQVLPHHRQVQLTLEITARAVDARGVLAIANGSLWVDGTRIYEAQGLGVRIVAGT